MNTSKFRYSGKDRGFARRMGYDDGGDVEPDQDSDDQGSGDAATSGEGFGETLRGISQAGNKADWNKFESEARPSTNVQDDRSKGWTKYIPSIGSVASATGGLTDAGD